MEQPDWTPAPVNAHARAHDALCRQPTVKPATIRDVASAAGVSITSVSRYLNKHLVLTGGTAKHIDEAVERLGYRPNALRKRLSMGITQMIGIVTPDIANSFFASIASTAQEEARKHGYSLVICNTGNAVEQELDYLDRLAFRGLDGLIFLTNHPDDGTLRDRIAQAGHVVLVDEDVSGAGARRLFVENHAGSSIATRHLADHGHRRIAHITGARGLTSVEERLAGYRDAMAEARLNVNEDWIVAGTYDEESGRTAMIRLLALPDRPTAIVAASDLLALGVYGACQDAGLAVPDDISDVGFDDLPCARFLAPPLTTVRQPTTDMGCRSVALLLRAIEGGTIGTGTERLPVTLIERESVARC